MIDLTQMSVYRENNRLEAKRATGGFPQSLWETYSAFANTIGGLILLGVEEQADKTFRAVGVPDSQGYIKTFWAHVQNPALVSVNILSPKHVYAQMVDGKEILVIDIPRAHRRQRPVFLGENPFTGSYRRDGEGDYHCTPNEVRSMLRDRGDLPIDLATMTKLSMDDFSSESLRAYRLLLATRNPEHPYTRLPDEQFLLSCGAAAWGLDGKTLHPTTAGLLLLGTRQAIYGTFPHYHLAYRETDAEDVLISSSDTDWSGNLFDFYTRVSQRLTEISLALAPEDAVLDSSMREAAVNAILHADYFSPQGLHILHLPDALQVTNSGLFRVDPEAAQKGTADARNLGLSRLFALIGVGTGSGSGLRGIYATWAQNGWQEPRITENFGPDTTSLRLPLPDFPTDSLRQQILEHLTRAISASPMQLAQALSASPLLVQKALSQLAENHLISRDEAQAIYQLRA